MAGVRVGELGQRVWWPGLQASSAALAYVTGAGMASVWRGCKLTSEEPLLRKFQLSWNFKIMAQVETSKLWHKMS